MFTFRNLKKPINTGSGIADYALLAPVYDFVEGGIKGPQPPYTNPGDQVRVKLDHQFKEGRAFAQFQLAPEKNKLDVSTIGDKGFNKLDQTLEIFIPGSYAEAHEAIKNLLNTPLVALAPDANCTSGIVYQLGTNCVYAYLTADFSTGTTKEGLKGYNARINYAGSCILLYEGLIEILDKAAPVGNSAVFLAPLSADSVSGDVTQMQIGYNSRLSQNIYDIFDYLVDFATDNVLQLSLANDQGLQVSDYLLNVDLTSEMTLIDTLEAWLATNGDGQSLQLSGDQLRLVDPGAVKSYFGMAIPQNLLGDGNGNVFLARDGVLLTAY